MGPEEELPQVLMALLGAEIIGKCVQPYQAPADSTKTVDTTAATGLILCPCDSAASRPPLRLAVGSLEVPLPWLSLLQPVEGETGLCLLRIHAASDDEAPTVGVAMLLGESHVISFDFEQETVGLCTARKGVVGQLLQPASRPQVQLNAGLKTQSSHNKDETTTT